MIPLPNQPKIIEDKDNKASFEFSPLYPGYGVTIGNSLRRVLLSSLEGTVATSVKIDGVAHEFSAVSNVQEDVIDIILNIKMIRFKMLEDMASDEPIKIEFSVTGEKEFKAKDIKLPAGIEIINGEQHIATLTDKKAKFSGEMEISRGTGYIPSEQLQKDKLPVGMISLDAAFSPVRFVNYTIENIRMGQRTDYNKLILDVETDGSISPSEALLKASEILISHYSLIVNDEDLKKSSENAQAKSAKVSKKSSKKDAKEN